MTTPEEYKRVALALLDSFYQITQEHMAMSETLRRLPELERASLGYLPQAKQAVDALFVPLRLALESGSGIQPALEALQKLPG